MHTCIKCMHVCTHACDCSDSLIMALQGLKHGSFNNTDCWELPIDTVFLLVNLQKKNQCICNCRIINIVHY
jgi:hypothetical protein